MTGILIEFLVGLFTFANSIDGSLNKPTIHWVKLIIGLILIILVIVGFDISSIRFPFVVR